MELLSEVGSPSTEWRWGEGLRVAPVRGLAAWRQTSWLGGRRPALNRTEMTLGSPWSRGSDWPGALGEGEAECKRQAGCFGVLLPLEAQGGGVQSRAGLGADSTWQALSQQRRALASSVLPALPWPPPASPPSRFPSPTPPHLLLLWPDRTPQAAHPPSARTASPGLPSRLRL